MKLLNFRECEVNVYHLQGSNLSEYYARLYDSNISNTFHADNLTIITTFTDMGVKGVHWQLLNNSIPWINSYKMEYGLWSMPNKVDYIRKALDEVNTDYVMILDDYDVLINDLVDIVNRYKSYGPQTKVLFNASKNNYPTQNIDKIPYRDYLGEFKFFNAGNCIGEVQFLKWFYDQCIEVKNNPEQYPNVFNSEQFLLRHVFSRFSENLANSPIQIDYDCRVFICMGNSIIYPSGDNIIVK